MLPLIVLCLSIVIPLEGLLGVTIILEDTQGINLMSEFQHNIRYWFNEQNYIYL